MFGILNFIRRKLGITELESRYKTIIKDLKIHIENARIRLDNDQAAILELREKVSALFQDNLDKSYSFKFYGQFDLPVDKFIFERYFFDLNIRGIAVECGAFDGLTECSCKFFEETMGWRVYNFEPVPWIFEKLQKNRPLAVNLNLGLSNICGKAKFYAVKHPDFGLMCTNGFLNHLPEHKEELVRMGCEFVEIEVELMTWKDFIELHSITHVDLFVLDVEGHEIKVIEGMKNSSVLPDIICVEHGHLGLDTIRSYLEPLGYYYDVSSYVNSYFIKREKIPLFISRTLRN